LANNYVGFFMFMAFMSQMLKIWEKPLKHWQKIWK
jgi:hypothetical protein